MEVIYRVEYHRARTNNDDCSCSTHITLGYFPSAAKASEAIRDSQFNSDDCTISLQPFNQLLWSLEAEKAYRPE